jgi:hypothetical protein
VTYSPYKPPPYVDPRRQLDPYGQPRMPLVWIFYIVYCVLMALLYLACAAGGAVLVAMHSQVRAADMSPTEALVTGLVLLVISLLLLILFAVAPLLPRGRIAWIIGFVTIGIGMTSVCTLLPCVLLLVFWLQADTKAYFGVT